MSEPVGNGPRINIPSNSHKSKEKVAKAEKQLEERKRPDKVIEGKIVEIKTPWYRKAARSMVAEDASSVGGYVLDELLIPGVKNLLLDMLTQGATRALWGGNAPRSAHRAGVFGRSSLKSRYHDVPAERQRTFSPSERSQHEFGNMIIETRDEAMKVIVALDDLIAEYGQATVADLYDILGVSRDYTDLKWGWTNLRNADVRQVRGGYILELPRTEQLR